MYFAKEHSYRYSNFDEVYEKVYGQDDYMFNYVNGLAITQIYWPNHYKIFRFFLDNFLKQLDPNAQLNCAEIGVGHGLFHAHLLSHLLIITHQN